MTVLARTLAAVFTFSLAAAGLRDAGAQPAPPSPEGHVSSAQQRLVVSTPPVDAATLFRFGLLTLRTSEGTTCSASMLNPYWVITAAHCVHSVNAPCALLAANQISLTASWPGMPPAGKTVQARNVVVFDGTPGCTPPVVVGQPLAAGPTDVAILQVGLHDFSRPPNSDDFGSANTGPQLAVKSPPGNSTVTAFGRGISQWAFWSGAPGASAATQTVADGRYRSVPFPILNLNPNGYMLSGGAGASVAGGDSGGPSLYQDWDDEGSPRRKLIWRLVGVHSGCSVINCLPFKSCPPADRWTWASGASQCFDASVTLVRNQILAAIEAVPADDQVVSPFGQTPPEVLAAPTALYAVSLDEPLLAPPGAASNVQLTFQRCHDATRLVQGCPLSPAVQTWSYAVATRHLVHTPSGKCVSVFFSRGVVATPARGAAADTPIGLLPCDANAAAQKWTRTGTSAGSASPPWTFRSALNGLCLYAKPGERPANQRIALTPAAELTLAVCNGSASELFVDADAAYLRRSGPR